MREKRTVPMSAMGDPVAGDSFESAVEPERFMPVDALWPGHWASLPHGWGAAPEERLLLQFEEAEVHVGCRVARIEAQGCRKCVPGLRSMTQICAHRT